MFALALLVAVLVVGMSVAGQRNWIELGGPFRLQPSEFAKLALVLWSADLLARKEPLLDQWKHLLVPLLPVAFIVIGLVLPEGDLGTALVLIPMVGVALLVAGAPARLFAAGAVGVAGLVVVASMSKGYRLDRFRALARPGVRPARPRLAGRCTARARSAAAAGSGVGLGASREKWGWLPAAHTDFIFAVWARSSA